MKRIASVASIVMVAGLTLVGCAEDPCPKLPPPTPEQSRVAETSEVEREVGNYECVVVDGRWVLDSS